MKCHAVAVLLATVFSGDSLALGQAQITRPEVSEQACPITVIAPPTSDKRKATALVRKPPGKGPFPALIHIHGGFEPYSMDRMKGFLMGQTPSRFLAAGYVTAVVTYRGLTNDPQTKDPVVDCLAIIEHVKKMPEVDPKSIVLWGDSGGGSLALELAGETQLCAIAAQEPATVLFTGMFNKDSLGGKPPFKVSDGQKIMEDPKSYYTPELQEHTRDKIGKINCPIFIGQGDKHIINKINNEIFIPELKKAEKKLEVILYPGAPHGFSWGFGTPQVAKQFFDDTHAFFKKHVPTPPIALDESLVKQVPVKAKSQ
jgi:acetyl esterase/lipase